MSLYGEYKFFINAYGGMYKGVPTLCFVVIYLADSITNPKSAIFQLFLPCKMFAGFKSR